MKLSGDYKLSSNRRDVFFPVCGPAVQVQYHAVFFNI